MAKTSIDVRALYDDLDKARDSRGLSWRTLAKEIGVSPSLLSRMANGLKPDTEGFASIVTWLRADANDYFISPADEGIRSAGEGAAEPDLMTSIGAVLRTRKDLDDKERAYLEQVFRATIDGYKALK